MNILAGSKPVERFAALLVRLQAAYADLKPKRIGLRYINRLAVPLSESLDSWLNVCMKAPDFLQSPAGFSMRQTWHGMAGFDDLAATILVSRVAIDEPVAPEFMGVLLDIDIFNFLPESAPTYAELLGWYRRAHLAERVVFEGSITDRARRSFGGDQHAAI